MCDIKKDWLFSDGLFMRPVTPKASDVVDFLPGRFCLFAHGLKGKLILKISC